MTPRALSIKISPDREVFVERLDPRNDRCLLMCLVYVVFVHFATVVTYEDICVPQNGIPAGFRGTLDTCLEAQSIGPLFSTITKAPSCI